MATHPGMLIGYDAAGDIVATLDYLVQYDEDGVPLGIVDFAAHEEAGGDHTAIWQVAGANDGQPWLGVGSKVWPEWLGARAHEFRVELEGPPGRKRIAVLVHKTSGHRRERADVETAIQARLEEKRLEAEARAAVIRALMPRRDAAGRFLAVPDVAVTPEPADIRDLVGGPDRPLHLDESGRTAVRAPVTRPALPLVGVRAPDVYAAQQTRQGD